MSTQYLWGFIMKKLTFIAIAAGASMAFSSGAFAFGNHWGGGSQADDTCAVCESGVRVNAPQIQHTSLSGSSASAWALGQGSYANNNFSSNTSGVTLNAQSVQSTNLKNTSVMLNHPPPPHPVRGAFRPPRRRQGDGQRQPRGAELLDQQRLHHLPITTSVRE